MENLLESFKDLFILEKRARDIYSAVLEGYPEDREAVKEITFIRNQEIGHMALAQKLIEVAESAEKRTGRAIISGKAKKSLDQDLLSKGQLLGAISQLINTKIQAIILLNLLGKRSSKFQRENKLRQELTKTIVHHLKNPLTVTKWISDLLLQEKTEKLTKRQRGMVKRIKTANGAMFSLVSDMLEMSRYEEDSQKIKKEKVDLVKIAATNIKELENLVKIRGQKINFQTFKKEVIILSDAKILGLVISNLLGNAIRYGKKGGKISIKIQKPKTGNVLISFADEGIGIPQKEQKDVFQKFFRASNAKKLSPQGSGLGLYMTRELAGKLGGKIWFKSQENKGSEFFLFL